MALEGFKSFRMNNDTKSTLKRLLGADILATRQQIHIAPAVHSLSSEENSTRITLNSFGRRPSRQERGRATA